MNQLLEQARSLHRDGRLGDAERLYRAALAADRRDAAAVLQFGLLRLQQGQPAEAVLLIREALASDPNSVQAHANLAAALQALQRHDEAICCYEQALVLDPAFAEAEYGIATALQALGRHAAALVRFAAARAKKPGFAEASYGLATAYHALSRHDEAIGAYRAALALDPDYAEASCGVGAALQAIGRHEEALAHYRAALDVDPDYLEALRGSAAALYALHQYEPAVAVYRKALTLAPGHAETGSNLAIVLLALGRHAEALACCEQAIALDPALAAAHATLGNILRACERHAEAVAGYQRALAIAPDFVDAWINCAASLQALDRHDEAITVCRRALALAPRSAAAHSALARALLEIGRLDEAYNAFAAAVAIAPRDTGIYLNLFNCRRVTAGDPYLAALEELAGDPKSLGDNARLHLDFALAKASADLGDDERAFGHLLAGNAAKRRTIVYDEPAVMRWFDGVERVLNAAAIRRCANLGDPSAVPVFIVGMMRSGTTLVEQILASHPRVHAAGERKYFGNAIDSAFAVTGAGDGGAGWPLDGAALRRLGAAYVAQLCAGVPTAEKVTDKMPANFRFVGLIHLALPNARIIHLRRDPIDTCLSIFSRLFSDEQPFAYDLGELGRYYRAYDRLMAHWRRVLPAGVMLEMRYEDLVADFETQARRLVAYCGLEWDDACRLFYRAQRPVKTASVAQVRQPVYRTSVGRWRPDRTLLQPLLDGIGISP
jgi:tetratricopeptide (TPR) repeat protein